MSEPILTISFIPLFGKELRIYISANKCLNKDDILELVEEFTAKFKEEIKNEAN